MRGEGNKQLKAWNSGVRNKDNTIKLLNAIKLDIVRNFSYNCLSNGNFTSLKVLHKLQ